MTVLKVQAELVRSGLQNFKSLRHYFLTNTITGQYCNTKWAAHAHILLFKT